MNLGRDTAGAFSIGEPRRDGNNFRVVPGEAAHERILNELPKFISAVEPGSEFLDDLVAS
ncbi:MAG: hypothetical protein KUA37_08615 [Desulfomicrobium sp.]|nr:hypothetical protein [Desulfomicrobium sp.]